ncbi:MAG TPA: hypothetical protein VNF47_13535 [Streptosporangiaceae bacterium]|nr:hypothetical protein [Streptosporangiaceae bacterium]
MPRQIVIADELPVSGYGKVLRQLLTEELKSRDLWPSPETER